MNSIKVLKNLNKKMVLLRLDLNVPLKNGSITDETRINKVIPIINFLIKEQSKIIIISHVGRPKGRIITDLSLKPICENIEKKMNRKIRLIKEDIFKLEKEDLFEDPNDQIVFLENIRFYEEEEKNDTNFAKHLAKLADLYVNDAFSCSHRAHASVSKITEFLPSFAGLQLETEIRALKKVTSEIKKPITCIIGGSKISTKIGIIKNLISKFDNLIIVGGMANNIIKYKGNQIGKSIREENCDLMIKEIFETLKNYSCKIIFPDDVLIGKNLDDEPQVKELNNIQDNDIILDIGPKTLDKIKSIIENSKTVLWNGPAGYFENPNFANGSYEIAKAITKKNKNNSLYSVVGGGDTIALINKIKLIDSFNFVSTAGGAFLEYLEGKELPGIKALS
ncbi:phosphoglycerate kinase [Candidatus Pelagibacter sp. RS39]|uniref:phosphoglycerate kinase n=1 Tax=Candidatus Pelagibacter sp. RS39 TaxID=1977864 RepID=UPI000A1604AC|nr:phosphoglycerate kinase [Candidatus Pelagibacter sp. RS39]ARJ47545.1 phosphoglycerate kinase [Candidatus Pelagibacter sp. RS39]